MAVSEHLLERMLMAGVNKLCFVIAPGKGDILDYFGGRFGSAEVCYTVQSRPAGLCDALFRALPLIADDEMACVGLPDTIWFPSEGFRALPGSGLSFLLFPVRQPQFFDAVVFDAQHRVSEIEVKARLPKSQWVWGAFKASGRILRELHALWQEPGRQDEYVGTLVNSYIARGGSAVAVPAGQTYLDVGTFNGYREASRLLEAGSARHSELSSSARRGQASQLLAH